MTTNYFVCTLDQAPDFQKKDEPTTIISHFLHHQAQHVGHLPAVAFPVPVQDRDIWDYAIFTFQDIDRGSQIIAEHLLNQVGDTLREPQTVALLCPSSPKFLFTWLALLKLGHSVLLVAPQCQPSAISYLCRVSQAALLLYDKQYAAQSLAAESAVEEGCLTLEMDV